MKWIIYCLAMFAPLSRACDCAEPKLPEAMKQSAAIFSGAVTDIARDEKNDTLTVTLKLDRSWKGEADKTLKVQTGAHGANCGYRFEMGKTYLVYATEETKTLYTGLCTRTKKIDDAAEDIKALGEGKAVAAQKPEEK